MSKEAKVIRGQVRQIVQEILGDILTEQLYKQLEHKLALRVEQIEKSVKATMHEMNENHKATMGYLVRTVTSPEMPKPKQD